jgi:glycerate 2-kinase
MIAAGHGPSGENVTVRVVIGPDKFKGSLTAAEAARAMAEGWRRGDPGAEIHEAPIADGGEGTLEALVAALGGRVERTRVSGPLGDPVEAEFGLADTADGLVAIVEMARASGLHLVPEDRRDPLRATTFGTGEAIRAACGHGPRRVLVCIGGSATNDAGGGMAQALGVRLLDEEGHDLPPGGAALERLARIDLTGLDPAVRGVEVVVATDVRNPLIGPQGASAVYGPQKGAAPEDVAALERALGHFAAVVHRDLGLDLRHEPGAGAAGGLGAGLVAFLGARLRPGFEVVAEVLSLGRRLEAADVAVTGEGNYDRQTEFGKAPAGFLRMARESGCRTVLVAGRVDPGVDPPADLVYSLADRVGETAAMDRARDLVEDLAAEAAEALREG